MKENLVHKDGYIKAIEFKEGEKHYRVVNTCSGGFRVWETIDTIKNLGTGARRQFTRKQLYDRFKQVELLKNEDKYSRVRKRNVSKQR